MAEYFKSLDPPLVHSLENKLAELKSFKLPKNLLNYLKGDSLRIEIENSDCINFMYIEDIIVVLFVYLYIL